MSYPTWDRAHAEEMKGPYKSGQLRMEVYRNNCEVFKNGGYTTESGKDVLMPVDDPMLAGTKFYSEEFSVEHQRRVPTFVYSNPLITDLLLPTLIPFCVCDQEISRNQFPSMRIWRLKLRK